MYKRVIKYKNFPLFCVIFYLRVATLFFNLFIYLFKNFPQKEEIFRKFTELY